MRGGRPVEVIGPGATRGRGRTAPCRRWLAAVVCTLALGLTACASGDAEQTAGRPDPELQARVDSLLPRIAEVAGLPVLGTPEVRRSDRSTLESYLLTRLEAEYPGDSLRNLELAYREFGLLADTVDLRTLLVDLLLEQAVGYYDPGRDALFIREEVTPDQLDAVLVHELVHALQDQHTDLDSLSRSRPGNDARSAAHGAIEGHATVAMMLYTLSGTTGREVSPGALPELSPEMAGLVSAGSSFPRLSGAPSIIRETLLFTYLGGGRYVQRLWQAQPGRPLPFGDWLPESTEQLLHTSRLLGTRDSPTRLELGSPGAGTRTIFTSDLGELELRIYFEEHLDDRAEAARAAAGWDGDVYALLDHDGRLALVWYTAWDGDGEAEEFIASYRRVFAARFGGRAGTRILEAPDRRARIERADIRGIPVVRIVETPPDVEVDDPPPVRLADR